EATEHMSFTVSLSKELERDITITTSLGPVTIKAGERSGEVYSYINSFNFINQESKRKVA
ncbi:hypothetical protein, partial [Sulfuricurvum sp.]|uniref:hypothetical protein n=1 Tax=Sulfuricurvum sp. TaxID=2025608 RepID=UPI003BB53E91